MLSCEHDSAAVLPRLLVLGPRRRSRVRVVRMEEPVVGLRDEVARIREGRHPGIAVPLGVPPDVTAAPEIVASLQRVGFVDSYRGLVLRTAYLGAVPEGDTIHRTATALRAALLEKVMTGSRPPA